MRSGVVIFPGSNCDRDMIVAIRKITGKTPIKIWHKEYDIPNLDLIVIPGGFTFGDYLRCGALAARSPVISSIKNHISRGGTVLGVCNGFQILIEAKILPGSLIRNENLLFTCRETTLEVQSCMKNPFLSSFKIGECLKIPVAHNEGNYFCSDEELKAINENNQVALTYCDLDGTDNEEFNPNGAIKNIAGVFNKSKNVLGMMPHPERMIDKYLSGEDGSIFFENLLKINN